MLLGEQSEFFENWLDLPVADMAVPTKINQEYQIVSAIAVTATQCCHTLIPSGVLGEVWMD